MAEIVQFTPRDRDGDNSPIRRSRKPARYCAHLHVEVDERARIVECVDCGASVDPIAALSMLAHEIDRYTMAREEAQRRARVAENDLEVLKRAVKNAKAQLRRAARPGVSAHGDI
jgi:hypothetical protein